MRSETEVAAMACPVCRVPLAMSDRQGIEIDYCPQCRGVWLDRGELDKIVERSTADAAPAPAARNAAPAPAAQPRGYDDDRYRQSGGGYGHGGKSHKRQKHWLSEIFD